MSNIFFREICDQYENSWTIRSMSKDFNHRNWFKFRSYVSDVTHGLSHDLDKIENFYNETLNFT